MPSTDAKTRTQATMEIQIVGQLRDLAQDPRNWATIVEDQGCLPGLVLFLDNQNKEVVRTAVEVGAWLGWGWIARAHVLGAQGLTPCHACGLPQGPLVACRVQEEQADNVERNRPCGKPERHS